MAPNLDLVIDRVRAGHGTRNDFELLREYLIRPDNNNERIYSAVTNYLEFSDPVDWSIAESYLQYTADPMVVATTISTAAIGGCLTESFWKNVLEIARGLIWDTGNDAQVQALLVLSRAPQGREEALEIIRESLVSDSEIVRDTAAIAAQRCFGRPDSQTVYEGAYGRLIESVGDDILNWIWPERGPANHNNK